MADPKSLRKTVILCVIAVFLIAAYLYMERVNRSSYSGPPEFNHVFKADTLMWHDRALFCPDCGTVLSKKPRLDSSTDGVVCEKEHHFFLTRKPGYADETIGVTDRVLPEGVKQPSEIIHYWLTDAGARRQISDQLASVLVRIQEIESEALRITDKLAFRLCPFCGQPLADKGSPDGWTTDFACADDHRWNTRSWDLFGRYEDGAIKINADLTDSQLAELVRLLLKDHTPSKSDVPVRSVSSRLPGPDRGLHDSIASVLIGYLQKSGQKPGGQDE